MITDKSMASYLHKSIEDLNIEETVYNVKFGAYINCQFSVEDSLMTI